jgi:hypothetical protein
MKLKNSCKCEEIKDRKGRRVSEVFYYFWLGRDGEREQHPLG